MECASRFGKSGVRGGVDLIYLEIVIAGSLFTCDCKYKEKKIILTNLPRAIMARLTHSFSAR